MPVHDSILPFHGFIEPGGKTKQGMVSTEAAHNAAAAGSNRLLPLVTGLRILFSQWVVATAMQSANCC